MLQPVVVPLATKTCLPWYSLEMNAQIPFTKHVVYAAHELMFGDRTFVANNPLLHLNQLH